MKAFCLRANEIDGTSTDGAIVAYYCELDPCGAQACQSAALNVAWRQNVHRSVLRHAESDGERRALTGGQDGAAAIHGRPGKGAVTSLLASCGRPLLGSHQRKLLSQNKLEIREIGISEPKQGAAVVARLARNVFDMADTADRSNTADGQTVKTFMAAVCFMDTMNYFEKDLGAAGTALLAEAKIKREHAAYRASVIAKALKSGTPVPPPKGESGDSAGVDDLDSLFASMPSVPGTAGGGAGAATPGLGLPPPPLSAPYTTPAPAAAPPPAAAPAQPPAFVAPAPTAAAPAVTAGAVSVAQQQAAQHHAKKAEQALKVTYPALPLPQMLGPHAPLSAADSTQAVYLT